MPKSDLPFGSEFSPSQVDLHRLLELAKRHGGNWKAFEAAVMARYFAHHEASDYNKRKLANNTKLGMIAYGIVDRNANLTEFGSALHAARSNESSLYEQLARHILLNLSGMTLVQCVRDIQAAGEEINLVKLREWLGERGIHFPRGGKHPSIMRLWLEKAGVFVSGWRVDEVRLRAIVGMPPEEVDILSRFSQEQRAYLRTLANMGGAGSFASNAVEKLAAATYGVKFNEKNLPKSVLYPLRDAGYIELQRGTKAGGRGAKPFVVSPTPKLVGDVLEPLLAQTEKQTHGDMRAMLRQPLVEVLNELDVNDKHRRGLALEALAFKLMRLLDMKYVATRLRGAATGGAEVDLIFEAARLVYSRWQIRCTGTPCVSRDDVAREVGLAYVTKANVIVIAGGRCVAPDAVKYATLVAGDRPVQIVFLGRDELRLISQSPEHLVIAIRTQSPGALCLRSAEDAEGRTHQNDELASLAVG